MEGTVGQQKIINWDGEGHKDNLKERWVHVDGLDVTLVLQILVERDSGTI